MRIAVDGRHLSAGRGVARYVRSLLDAWPAVHPQDEPVPVAGSRSAFAAAAATGRPRLERMAGGADVVWAPAPAPLAVGRGVPLVLTVHDLSWLERPADFTPYERLWHRAARIDRLVARADRVVAPSRATAREAARRWGIDDARLRVVLPGPGLVERPFPAPGGAEKGRSRPFFLAVGALEPRKEPGVLAEAYARARRRGLRADLVVAGGGREAAALRAAGAEIVEGAGDAELARLYAGALALVHPARLEGFGFPPVEAAVRGIPSVVADLAVYEETLGPAALRIPAGDAGALADALLRLEGDPALRDALGRAARAAVAGLSWERAARETRAVLAEAAGA